MTDFATKDDVQLVRNDVQLVRDDVQQLKGDVQQLKGDVQQIRGDVQELRGDVHRVETSLREDFHHLGVRFEQLETKVTAIGEGLLGLREHVTDEIRKLREELSGRIAVLERVVHESSEDMRALQAEVANLRRRFDRYEQESELEKRVTEIEKRLGIR